MQFPSPSAPSGEQVEGYDRHGFLARHCWLCDQPSYGTDPGNQTWLQRGPQPGNIRLSVAVVASSSRRLGATRVKAGVYLTTWKP